MESVAEIKALFKEASSEEIDGLVRRFAGDGRSGVQAAMESALRRAERERQEQARLASLYSYERELAASHGGEVVIGLDEVGRGPLAGPLAVGAVVLDADAPFIAGLDDSKKLTPQKRERAAQEIRELCKAWAVAYVSPQQIDDEGIAAALRRAFADALAQVEAQGVRVDVVLVDGNPLGLDEREVNVIKGDGKCASIAAASIIAKVDRDRLMDEFDEAHPGYGFASNKGYGSEFHISAIREQGLSTVHRKSFCTKIAQDAVR